MIFSDGAPLTLRQIWTPLSPSITLQPRLLSRSAQCNHHMPSPTHISHKSHTFSLNSHFSTPPLLNKITSHILIWPDFPYVLPSQWSQILFTRVQFLWGAYGAYKTTAKNGKGHDVRKKSRKVKGKGERGKRGTKKDKKEREGGWMKSVSNICLCQPWQRCTCTAITEQKMFWNKYSCTQ